VTSIRNAVLICLCILLVFGIAASRAEVVDYSRTLTLKWDAPTKRMDGTPMELSEILRYDIEFHGETYTAKPSATHYDVLVSAPGLYCAKIKTVDTNSLESPWSEPACLAIRHAPAKIRIWFDGAE
jgi:hypothetical protein